MVCIYQAKIRMSASVQRRILAVDDGSYTVVLHRTFGHSHCAQIILMCNNFKIKQLQHSYI